MIRIALSHVCFEQSKTNVAGARVTTYIAVCTTFILRFNTYIAVLLRFENVVTPSPPNVTVGLGLYKVSDGLTIWT